MARLLIDHVRLAYDGDDVIRDLSLEVPAGSITALVGPNGSGKSTLLRAVARLLKPRSGAVLLDGSEIARLPTRAVARRLGFLPQAPVAPDALLVEDLVARGRYPHQSLFRQWTSADQAAVECALQVTGTLELRERPVDSLSGGQRQKAWIAMALAQETEIMLLDEPTTFLDLAHQMDVLELLHDLNADHDRTIVVVMHDINQACRLAHHLVALADGQLYAQGPPCTAVSERLLLDVFGVRCRIITDPVTQTPLCLPIPRPKTRDKSTDQERGESLQPPHGSTI